MLYYKTYELGEKEEWIVLIHGAGGSSTIWYKQIKEYKKHFNVLMVDLRGHGKSQNVYSYKNYTFEDISQDVLEVMDHLNIEKAHFIGISLGTLIINTLSDLAPQRIESMILGGAVTRLTFQSKFLISVGNTFKKIVPYMWLYKILAWIIMPKKRHEKSRLLFIKEAQKLYQKEFVRWFQLAKDVNLIHIKTQSRKEKIPTLYIMGDEDYMFLPPIISIMEKEVDEMQKLEVIENSGHVCNVDQPEKFNQASISFIKKVVELKKNFI